MPIIIYKQNKTKQTRHNSQSTNNIKLTPLKHTDWGINKRMNKKRKKRQTYQNMKMTHTPMPTISAKTEMATNAINDITNIAIWIDIDSNSDKITNIQRK